MRQATNCTTLSVLSLLRSSVIVDTVEVHGLDYGYGQGKLVDMIQYIALQIA